MANGGLLSLSQQVSTHLFLVEIACVTQRTKCELVLALSKVLTRFREEYEFLFKSGNEPRFVRRCVV